MTARLDLHLSPAARSLKKKTFYFEKLYTLLMPACELMEVSISKPGACLPTTQMDKYSLLSSLQQPDKQKILVNKNIIYVIPHIRAQAYKNT